MEDIIVQYEYRGEWKTLADIIIDLEEHFEYPEHIEDYLSTYLPQANVRYLTRKDYCYERLHNRRTI